MDCFQQLCPTMPFRRGCCPRKNEIFAALAGTMVYQLVWNHRWFPYGRHWRARTTRSRVSFFMNRFRKLGFINYDVGDKVHVHSSLLNVVLHDDNGKPAASGAENSTVPASRRGLEPPTSPGSPPDKERARRPPLPSIE